jgi:AcrR family transcriptional regulator
MLFRQRSIDCSMAKKTTKRLGRDDWLSAALKMCDRGIDQVKIAPLAKRMGVTTGSFYWHFSNRQALLDALLAYWERELTDMAIVKAREANVTPEERILLLMETVMVGNIARYDLPIWAWAQSDSNARRVFNRVLKKRFTFAAWLFEEAGFTPEQAKTRGRLMVTYMMGESTLVRDKEARSKQAIRLKHAILMSPES